MEQSADLTILRPENLLEALNVMGARVQAGENVKVLGGGTDLMPHFKRYPNEAATLISISRLQGLGGIRKDGDALSIGASVRIADISENEVLRAHFPGLSEAAGLVASPQIRNRASVAGNLLVNNRCHFFNQSPVNRSYHSDCYKAGGGACHVIRNAKSGDHPLCRARFVSDLAPVFLVLGAKLKICSASGERFLNLNEFYLQDGIDRNALKPGELVVEIGISLRSRVRVAYEKLRIRRTLEFPSVGVAVGGEMEDGRVSELRLALTGVQTHPILVCEKPDGRDDEAFARLVERAVDLAQPLRQEFFPPDYRRKMIPVLARRAYARMKGNDNGH